MELTMFKIYISSCDKNEILNMDGSYLNKKRQRFCNAQQ